MPGMEDRVVRGIRWTFLGYGGTRLGSLLTTFVLARLLVPDDFGVVAFAALLIAGVLLFGTLGVSSAVVVRQDLRPGDLRTGFTLSLATYAACAVVIVALSPLAGDLLNQPDASAVLRALAIPVAFGGVTFFYAAILQRELEFRKQFACVTGRVIATAATAVPLAATGAGVWSLVAGQIAGAAVYTVMLISLSPFRVRPGFDRTVAQTLLGSGWGFMLQGGLSFVEQNADYAVVGTKVGSTALGQYSMAYRVGEIPYNLIVEPISQATFPGFARMRRRSENVAGPFLTTLRLTAACALPLGLIASGAAEPLVRALLGEKWIGMIGVLQILGLWGSVRVVQATIEWFLLSFGVSGLVGISYVVVVGLSIPLLIVAADTAGTSGVAWVMLGNVLCLAAIMTAISNRRASVPFRHQWGAVRPSLIAAAPAWLVARVIAELADGIPVGIAAVVSVSCAVASYVGIIWVVDRRLPADAVAQLRRVLAIEERRTGFEPATSSLGSSRSTY